MIYTIFIIPVMIIVIGYLMNKYPPKKPNYLIGYRTRKSIQNNDIWKTANQYCGALWIKIGLLMLIITSIISILSYYELINFTENLLIIVTVSEVIILVQTIFIVENKIKDMI